MIKNVILILGLIGTLNANITPPIWPYKDEEYWSGDMREDSIQKMPSSDNEVFSFLMKAATQYITILNRIGSSANSCLSEEIMPLCAKNCIKVRNGKLLFKEKKFFPAQLDAGKEWLGSWSINLQEVLVSIDSKTTTIRYELATEKEDELVIIAILHFDSHYLITEINEVHNKLEK